MTERMFGTVADTYPTGGSAEQKAVTDYIATMHPGVGLALADLLDFTANEHEGDGPEGCWECVRWTTITRLILGGAS